MNLHRRAWPRGGCRIWSSPPGDTRLDQRAIAIVQASPFIAFSAEMLKAPRSLVITSRFRFTRDEGLATTLVWPIHDSRSICRGGQSCRGTAARPPSMPHRRPEPRPQTLMQ